MPLISVVMPVYNTEKYVSKAIESILNQTFQDFEFLIIDNGSTDSSGEIISQYAALDNRIHIIKNKQNVFIAQARNAAIDMATGEYLYLIDSDDWALPEMLQKMYTKAKENNAQYVVSGYFMDYYVQNKASTYIVCPDDRFYLQDEFRKNAIRYLTRTLLTVPWNKLYSLSYLREHNIRFRNTKLEDHHFNMDIIMDVERVYMVGEAFYHYYRSRQGTDSQVVYNQYLNQKKRDHLRHTLEVYSHWGIQDEETMCQLANYHMGRLIECVAETINNVTIDKKTRRNEIDIILQDELTHFAIKYAKPKSSKIRILSTPIKLESIPLCYIMGWSVGFVKKHFSNLFYRMRGTIAQGAYTATSDKENI